MHTNKVQYLGSDGKAYATFWTHDQQSARLPDKPDNIPDGYEFVGWKGTNGDLNYVTGAITAIPIFKDKTTGAIKEGW